MKIYAGEQFRGIYRFAADHNVTAIGGGDPNVGIAGWLMGGGHGPLTAKYGMGADQVIEMEVVTADGRLRTVNEKHDPDLFWALRGVSSSHYLDHVSIC
jgi:FAD/FMN-containing dehydrogenase